MPLLPGPVRRGDAKEGSEAAHRVRRAAIW
jgi:hypothetical protein